MIQTTAPALLAALNGAASKIVAKGSSPFVAFAQIDARGVNVTDYEIDAVQRYAAVGPDEGAFFLERAALKRILAKIGDAPIVLAPGSDGACILSSPRGAFTLAQMTAAEWPKAQPVPVDAAPLEVAADTLRNMLERAVVATTKDQSRPVLASVCLARHADGFELVGCDSYRLHVLAHGDVGRDDGRRSLMPRAFCEAVIERIKKLRPATVTISADTGRNPGGGNDAGYVRVTVGDWTGSCRLVAGTYPDYRRLFPNKAAATAILPAADMIAAIDLAEAAGARTNAPFMLRVGPGESSLSIDSHMGAAFTAPLTMLYDYEHGTDNADGMTIGYNPAFLADMIGAAQSDSPILSMISPQRPSWITSVGCAQCGTPIDGHGVAFTGLLMPIRLS